MTVVLLAAGKSSRTTQMKQLYKIDGVYLINKQIQGLESYGYEVVVVLGHAFDTIATVICKDVKIIRNYNYERGMFSSVQRAFEVLDKKRLVFSHIDRPLADKEVFEAVYASEYPIATASYKGKNAPPIMIDSSMKQELLASDASRLDYWIASTNKAQRMVVKDAKVSFNANTDEALEKFFSCKGQ